MIGLDCRRDRSLRAVRIARRWNYISNYGLLRRNMKFSFIFNGLTPQLYQTNVGYAAIAKDGCSNNDAVEMSKKPLASGSFGETRRGLRSTENRR